MVRKPEGIQKRGSRKLGRQRAGVTWTYYALFVEVPLPCARSHCTGAFSTITRDKPAAFTRNNSLSPSLTSPPTTSDSRALLVPTNLAAGVGNFPWALSPARCPLA